MPRTLTSLFGTAALAAALMAATAAPALAQKTDVVILINNDTFTCEIKKLDKGRLTASTDHLGTVDIEWDKVRSIFSNRSFTVDTSAGLRVFGQLAMGGTGDLEVVTSAGAVSVRLADVVAIVQVGDGFWRRLDGSLDLGLSYTQSSGVAQFNFNASATYRNERMQTTLSGSSYLTKEADQDDTSRHTVQLGAARRIGTHWAWLVQGGFERNEELGYKVRGTVTTGGGRYFVRTNRAQLAMGTGLSSSREVPIDGDTTQSLDAYFTVRQSYFTYDSPKTDMSTTLDVYPGLSQWGRVRLQLDAKIKREVVKDLSLGFTLYDSYDNRPPTADSRKNDVGLSLTIGWTF